MNLFDRSSEGIESQKSSPSHPSPPNADSPLEPSIDIPVSPNENEQEKIDLSNFTTIGDERKLGATDEIIEKMAQQYPLLKEILSAQTLDEQIALIQPPITQEKYERLHAFLMTIQFFYREKDRRLPEALKLAELEYHLAQMLPHEWSPELLMGHSPARHMADALQSLADIYLELGKPSKALDDYLLAEEWYYRDALERERQKLTLENNFDRTFNQNPRATLFTNISRLYQNIGDQDKAEEYRNRQHEIEQQITTNESRISFLLRLGDKALAIGDLDGALMTFHQALDIALADSNSKITARNIVTTCHCIGETLSRLGLYRQALHYHQKSLELNLKARHLDRMSYDYRDMGKIFEVRPDLGDALAAYEAALICASERVEDSARYTWRTSDGTLWRIGEPESAWSSALALGRACLHSQAYERADTLIALAIELGETIRSNILQEEYRIGYQSNRQEAYKMAIEMHAQLALQTQSDYLAQQHSERAWEYIERAKSRAFLDSLGTSSFRLPDEIPTDVHKQETKLLESLESFNGLRSTQTTDRQHVTWDEYQTIRSQLDQLWQEMAQISPQAQDYVNLRQGQPISFQALKQLMTSRAAKPLETNLIQNRRVVLVEYFTTDDLTLLFLMREDFSEPIIKEIPRSAAEIRAFVAQYFSEELGANGSNVRSTSDKVRNLGEDDYQTFLQDFVSPLLESAPQGGPIARIGDIIWFVPHDFLHYLPLHAVKLDGQYLIDRNPVCYTPSASVMKYCHQKRKGKRETALILGDPLIYTTDQTLSIQALFQPGHAELHIEDATKDLLTSKLKAAKAEIDILHIACHGKFNRDQALQSGIQLQDGKLTAEEIFGLELNADLVTLSACESGINENQPGDELIGLTRALIYAGTPSVIVSLWEVDAISTSILMTKFYQKLLSGATKVDALQQAQLELRNMTAQEAIDTYYMTALQRFTEPSDRQQLQWDMANLCYNVGDFEKAASLYQNLHETIAPNSSDIARLDNLILQCELGGQNTSQLRPYAHPYFWAPFVLVGDWR